jgi:hypothetical protein
MSVYRFAISGVTFVVKKEPQNTLPHSRKTMHAEFKNKNDTINNMENWNYSKSLIKYVNNIPGKH